MEMSLEARRASRSDGADEATERRGHLPFALADASSQLAAAPAASCSASSSGSSRTVAKGANITQQIFKFNHWLYFRFYFYTSDKSED